MCLGLGLAYMMRVNISIAIVAMVDAAYGDDVFKWNVKIQSVILSSFSWGYFILQIPAGEMASRFGAKILVCVSIGLNAFLTLLTPLFAIYGGWQVVCACRFLQGLSQGFLFPCTHTLIGNWVPFEERSRLGTLIYAGTQIGATVTYIISGYIAAYINWQSIFYICGALGATWVGIYVAIGSSSPRVSKYINAKERDYILFSLGRTTETEYIKTPWKTILTSIPFLILIASHFGHTWGHWTLITLIPSYFAMVSKVDIKQNGLLSALPYLAIFVTSFPMGWLADMCTEKNWTSITVTRKIFNTIGYWGPAIMLIGLSYSPAGDVTVAVLFLCLAMALNAGSYAGYMLVHIDMAPNFAGQMMGITNSVANFLAIFAPLAAGQLLIDETSQSDWRKVFYMSVGIYFFTNLLFIIFGDCRRQSWNEGTDHEAIYNASRLSQVVGLNN
ncbi:putative inorganic phosphate cotransporter isoform X2 [Hyposmocoma kahamanoa]|nr:putative inorganic phosphate cotransporter isoform X2 [Hyposmocoma kahamanoa]